MDESRGKSVVAAFIQFHRDGLIYRDVRLTNWCCTLRSGISDIEVDYLDIEARTRLPVPGHPKDRTYVFGVIWSSPRLVPRRCLATWRWRSTPTTRATSNSTAA